MATGQSVVPRTVELGSGGLLEQRITAGTAAAISPRSRRKTELQLSDFWRLSVDNSESLKLQRNPATGGSHSGVKYISRGMTRYPLRGSQQTVGKS